MRLERIELLTRIVNMESSSKEKAIALEWIGEITEEMKVAVKEEMKNPQFEGGSGSRCGFQ